jgi:hypothetical protein
VTVFFLEVLPQLRPGALVHLHDVFLPDDYPPAWINRLYSEQYLLGVMLLCEARRFALFYPTILSAPIPSSVNTFVGFFAHQKTAMTFLSFTKRKPQRPEYPFGLK